MHRRHLIVVSAMAALAPQALRAQDRLGRLGRLAGDCAAHDEARLRSCELFADMAKVDIVHIPFEGGAPALNELLAGRLSFYFATMATAGPRITSDRSSSAGTRSSSKRWRHPKSPTNSTARACCPHPVRAKH